MSKTYSIAEAKDQLSTVVRKAEKGGPVEITRRGRPVAVVMGHAEFQRLSTPRPSLGDVIRDLRAAMEEEPLDIDPDEVFAGVEDRSLGQDVSF